jgi:hypothetical protein
MTPLAIIALLASHFVGDFVLQSDKMAMNKSTSFKWLYVHCLAYIFALLPFAHLASVGPSIGLGIWWIGNFAAHFLTDAVTSRITARLYAAGKRHWFFVMIGLDQLIHYSTLIGTWAWLAEAA